MRLLALCIGVDAQLDPDIPVLPFAGDDAAALWALAADWAEASGGGQFEAADCVLLRGRDATQAGIRAALDAMAARSERAEYDVALLHFAGHGHPAGVLWGADADAERPELGVSLADFTAAARRVRAQRAVVAVDACFSGRAGALVGAAAGAGAAGVALGAAAEAQLSALADERRAVVWACGADEQAWESPRLEHGLLSYGLVRALEHPAALERGTQLSLTAWIEQALRTTAAEAAVEGRTQTPGRHVLWNGGTTVPRPVVGERRRAQLAARRILPITEDVGTLAVYGLPAPVLEAVSRRIGGAGLSPMQQRAVVPGGLLAGHNVVVSAPTSTGKTLVGELAVLGAAARGRRAMFLLPSRALVEEKYAEFRDAFGPCGVTAVRSYGGVDDDDAALVGLHFDVAFLTYEKCLGMCLQRPDVLDALDVVVFDEVHLLGERARGTSVELLLALLRKRRAAAGRRPQIVALSAALGDMGGLPDWIEANPVAPDARPRPLRSGVVDPNGRFQYRDETADGVAFGETHLFAPEELVPAPAPASQWRDGVPVSAELLRREQVAATLVRERLRDPGARVLVFRATRPQAHALARQLAGSVRLEGGGAAARALGDGAAPREETRASLQLRRCLEAGVGFHQADLDRREREAVERAVRSGELRLTVATSTLAAGVNTPATDVILVDAERYDAAAGRDEPYDLGEVRNTLGRAGRWLPGVAAGAGYLAAASAAEADALYARYFRSEPATLTSKLHRANRDDLALILLGAGLAHSRETLVDALFDSFDGFQHEEDAAWRQSQRRALREAVDALAAHGFVREDDAAAGALELTPLGRVCAREGLRVASALRVLAAAEAVRGAGEPLDGVAITALTQITDELDDEATSVARREYGVWGAPLRELLSGRPGVLGALGDADPARRTCRQKRLFALVQWLRGVPAGDIEAQFGAAFDEARTFAGSIRRFGERTAQVARGVAALLAVRYPEDAAALRAAVLDLRPRLEHGLKRDSAGLAGARLGLSRAEIHWLLAAGYGTPEALAEGLRASPERFAATFDPARVDDLQARLDGAALRHLARRRRRHEAVQTHLFDGLTAVTEL